MENTNPPVRIVIADVQTLFRDGLRRLLESEPEFVVVGETADGAEAVARTRELAPDILLLDLGMPGLSGMDAIGELCSNRGGLHTKIILLTATVERMQIVQALQMGACGVVTKETSTQLLLKAIRTVMAGQYWIGREDVGNIIDFIRTPASGPKQPANYGLTKREMQIVTTIVAGLSNKEIARKFSLSEDTVKHHLTNIFEKVGVASRLELALFAITNRLAEPFSVPGAGAGGRAIA
jgi:two-component system nitrate/nitrite response regulator NarL